MLNVMRPVIKLILDEEADRNGTRTNIQHIFSSDSDENQRILTPAGNGTWDRWILVHVPFLRGDESDQELRAIADRVPLTYIEKQGPHLTRNRAYIFIVQKFGVKFMRSRFRAMGNMIRDRFWFFSAWMGPHQLTAHLQKCVGSVFRKRSEKLLEACQAKHVHPYKNMKRLIDFFQDVGDQLLQVSARTFERVRSGQKAGIPSNIPAMPIACEAARQILAIARGALPSAYEHIRAFIAIDYPGIGGPVAYKGGPARAAS